MDYGRFNQILLSGHHALYSAAVLVAGVAGSWFVLHDAAAWPLPPERKRSLFIAAFMGSLAGCALPNFFAGDFVGWQEDQYLIGPKTVIGGLLFGFLSVAIYKRLAREPFNTSDAFARGAALMMAIGRLGCYWGHCCFGIAVKRWGMDFGDGVKRFPVQLVEAAFLFGLFALIDFLHRRDRFPGRRLFLFFGLYGAGRFFLEFLREPIARAIGGLGYYQWLSLLLAATGVFQIWKKSAPALEFENAGVPVMERG